MKHNQVAWVEGMFIKPQHFEQQERCWQHNLSTRLNQLTNYSWGIYDYVIDEEYLSQNKICFRKCQGIFPDGTLFELDDLTLSQLVLSVSGNTFNQIVYLALPLNDHLSEQPNRNKRFCVEDLLVVDTLQPSAEKENVLVKRLGPSLIMNIENADNYTLIPILQIASADEKNGIYLNSNFVPPCLNINRNSNLTRYLKLLVDLVERKRKQLAQTLVNPAQGNHLVSMNDMALLQVLNRASVELQHALQLAQCHPHELFKILKLILAELGTFYCQDRSPIAVPEYNHNELYQCFNEIREKFVETLQVKFEHQAQMLDVTLQENGVYSANLIDYPLLQSADIVLCFQGKEDILPEKLEKFVKVSSIEDLNNIIQLQLSGVKLERMKLVPPQLPFYDDMIYLRIIKEGELWQNITTQQNLAFCLTHIPNPENYHVKMWAIPELHKRSA